MSDAGKAVFLSYASQDAEAAKRICDALRAAGVEVWFDQSELVGGDQWDGKIRGQIGSCALFVPIISASTQARLEGYFRLEWKLAAQRTHTMADEKTFLLPVLIDGTRDAEAKVPAEFKSVQWTKLPGGETPPAFVARVQKLLLGDVGRDRLIPPSPREPRDDRGGISDPALQKMSRPWLLPAILGVAALVGLALWQPWKKSGPAATGPATAALTEAQKLVQQAQTVYAKGDQLDRETLVLADDLVKRALVLDPAEPSAWELAARLSYFLVWQGFDTSEARKADLQRQAARARALAPESGPAQLAVVNAQLALAFSNFQSASNRQTMEAIERDLLVMAERAPNDYQVQQALGQTYRFLKKPDEALRALQRSLELSGGDPSVSADVINVLLRRKRYAEAEAMVAPALARRPIGRILGLDVMFKTIWRGDLPAAQAALVAWPGWLLREDRGAFLAWQTWLWSGRPDLALDVASRLPRDYLRDNWFTGPRAVLTARAHELAGHQEAAQADWRTVVRLTDRELTGALEDDAPALFWKAWAQSRLGDQAGALAISALLQQRNLNSAVFFRTTSFALLWSTLGRTDLAAEHLRTSADAVDDAYAVTRAMLELDPAYASLRADPQFAALATAALAPVAADPAPSSLLPAPAQTPAADAKSVAVLAFANLSDDKANEYFSDGISEELLNVLGRVPGLRVAAPLSAFSFKGKNVSAQEIGRKLNVAYLVNGSVRRAGAEVRVVARLSRADTGEQIWTDKFSGEAKNVFALQDEIAGKIAAALSLKLGASARTAKPIDPEAYRLYLEGRHFWSLRTFGGFDRAEVALKQAVALEPESALIRAGLAELYATRGWYRSQNALDAGNNYALASAEAERAVALDPDNAQAILARATIAIAQQQSAEAAPMLQRALALAPNDAGALNRLGDLMVQTGRLDAAVENYRRGMQLDPLSVYLVRDVVRQLLYARRHQDVVETVGRFEAGSPRDWRMIVWRAQALVHLGKTDQAAADLKSILPSITPDDFSSSGASMAELVFSLRVAQCEAESEALAKQLLARHRPGTYLHAMVLAARSRMDEAIPLMVAFPVGSEGRLFWSEIFDPVREDPRFLRKIEEFGVAAEYKVARETLARMVKEQEAKK